MGEMSAFWVKADICCKECSQTSDAHSLCQRGPITRRIAKPGCVALGQKRTHAVQQRMSAMSQ